jgi:hypothetical protein
MENKKIELDLDSQYEEFKLYKKLRNNPIALFLQDFIVASAKFYFFIWLFKKFGLI